MAETICYVIVFAKLRNVVSFGSKNMDVYSRLFFSLCMGHASQQRNTIMIDKLILSCKLNLICDWPTFIAYAYLHLGSPRCRSREWPAE